MQLFVAFLALCCAVSLQQVNALNEITSILTEANDLSTEEYKTLKPLFDELQTQYDYIISEAPQGNANDANVKLVEELEQFLRELEAKFEVPAMDYDTELPTVEELLGSDVQDADMSAEQSAELLDMQIILQEALTDAQLNINEIVEQARQMETTLIKINKPKIVGYIYKALSLLYGVAARGGRAAYCTYSHIPDLNSSLHDVYDGIDCYSYTTSLILRIQHETVQSVSTIRGNVFDLAAIYKKTNAKNSLLGKIVYLILNVTKIAKNILQTYSVAMKGMNDLQAELPTALAKSVQCGSNFVGRLPHLAETLSSLSTCILFVDDTTKDYDYMQPDEPEIDY